MSGLKTLTNPNSSALITISRQSISSQSTIHPFRLPLPTIRLKPYRYPTRFPNFASSNGNNNGLSNGNDNDNGTSSDENGEDDDPKKENGGTGLNLRWAQLLLDPDPDNLFAVGLTGLLTWASVQVVWQLLVVSLAIVVAGLKYSLVAALLIFILIALL